PPSACSGAQVRDLGGALEDVRRDRQPELGARLVELDRDRIGGVRRDTGPHPGRERLRDAVADRGEVFQPSGWIGAEDPEIDSGAQAELGAGDRGCAAVAAVANGRDARGETLRGSELRNLDILVPADSRL